MTWWGNLGPWPLILFKWFNTALLHSFKPMGSKFQLRNFRCHARWKRIHGALNLHCSSYISKIVWWLPMLGFGIFCHLLRLMGIYQVGPPSKCFEQISFSLFFSSFSFFFSILHFLFALSFGGPFSSGAPGHVHLCHPVATPLHWMFFS